jgi:hypothetical protein
MQRTRSAVYLLYWYKSTNTDTACMRRASVGSLRCVAASLLYWYKSANTDTSCMRQCGESEICSGELALLVQKCEY